MTDGICPFATQIWGVTTSSPGHIDRVGFCDHAAGGFYGTLTSASFWNGAGTSVHFGIARDGRICQIVNIFDRASAQGADAHGNSVSASSPGVTWPPFTGVNPNDLLISTEHEDAETVNGRTHFVPGSQWTEAQYAADLRVKQWCIEEVRRVMGVELMRYGIDSLAGHHMFDPVNRKECPGAFWRNEYRGRLFMDLTPAPPAPERLWLYGNEDAGEEVVGNQRWLWHRRIVIDKLGDEAGLFPGQHTHNQGGDWVTVLP